MDHRRYAPSFKNPKIVDSWVSLQESIDQLYKMSREAKRPIYPGYTRTALKALLAYKER